MAPLKDFTQLPAENKFTLDQAYEWHKIHSSHVPAFIYPDDNDQPQYVSWKQLGNAIDAGAQYITNHIPEITNEKQVSYEPLIVAVLASADHLTFATFLLASLRLTHSQTTRAILPFALSPKNSAVAIAHLLKVIQVKHVCVMEGSTQLLFTEALKHLQPEEIPSTFAFPKFQDLYNSRTSTSAEDRLLEQVPLDKPAIILHSSGSTSFPKPITITHQMLMEWSMRSIQGDLDLRGETVSAQNAPMFHAMGFFITGWAVHSGFIRSSPNPLSNKSPSDPESFLEEIMKSRTTVGYSVPNFLEAWSSNPQAIEFLKTLKAIIWGGGPLNHRIGQYLVSCGVNLVMLYGATEPGPVTYLQEKTWPEGYDWFKLPTTTEPAFLPYHTETNTFELVFKVTEGHHPGVTNTHIDGVSAYATSDLIERHPNNPALIRVKGRADDQIMHNTGEKTNPVPIERLISKNPHVRTAVIFGRGKPSNGVIIEPVSWDFAESLGLESFRNLIWPSVEDANEYAPAHSRIFKEMIILASRSKPFTYTAKNTARRGAVINDYEQEIESLYRVVEDSIQTDISPPEPDEHGEWSLEDSRRFVRKIVHSIMKNASTMKDEDDFFTHGCDSLLATYIRNTIVHALRQTASSSGVQTISNNFVYQHPTINALSEAVSQVSRQKRSMEDEELRSARQQRLQDFIRKYTQDWPRHLPQSVQTPNSEVILLTGSTGGLGSQILAELITTDSVSRIYAFNRASKIPLRERHIEAFTKRGNDLALLDSKKIIFVDGDTSAKDLGIAPELFNEIRNSVTTIIHNAWRVDFNISLVSFEPAIRGVRHLIDLALASPHAEPPRLLFHSSIGNVKLWAGIPAVPEASFKDMDLINSTGYNESKWICEQILEIASLETPLKPLIVRVGQLSGGINGNWNDREWFPALVRASQILRAAPENEGLVSFVPLHTAAKALAELRHSPCMYANIVHPRPITWNAVIKWVAEQLGVPIIPYSEWLARLEAAPRTSETLVTNPALHLLDFYRSAIPGSDRKDLHDSEAMGIANYETTNTIINAPTLRPGHLPQLTRDDVCRWIQYWNIS